MRPTICRHGVGPLAARVDSPPALMAASSEVVTHLCSAGVFLNVATHTAVHARLAVPRTMNDARQLYRATIASTRGGVTAPPSREKLWVIPWAKPRSRTGSQKVKA